MIRLFLIEDHPIVLEGLRNRFRASRDGISIAGYADDVEKAVELINTELVDIILLDLWIRKTDPYQNIQQLQASFPKLPIVIYSMEESFYWIRTMLDLGVKAFISKNSGKLDMKEILEAVMLGNVIIPEIPEMKNEEIYVSGKNFRLNPNEKELATMISKGLSLQEISAIKQITVSAIEKSLRKIKKRIGAKSLSEMIMILVNSKEIQYSDGRKKSD
jgi:DNA-binding NarL/FixJ family response regulator